MTEKLPKGWIKTLLSDVCLPVATIQPSDFPDSNFTYFDIGGIDNRWNRITETKNITGRNAPSRARQEVRKGDILFSTVRTYLKKIARLEQDYPNPVASTGFTVIRAAKGVSSEFLFFQILSDDFLEPLHKLQSGTSYPAVRDKDVFAQSILLPPTAEQEKIVSKLNATLSRLERAEVAARRAQERLQRYRATVLNSAVSGELTRSWRESQQKDKEAKTESGQALLQRLLMIRRARWEEAELNRLNSIGKTPKDEKWKFRYPTPTLHKTTNLPILPENWDWASIEQVSTRVTVGHVGSMRSEYVSSGIPFLRSQNVRVNRYDPEGLLFIRPEFHAKLIKSQIQSGDVVVVRSGLVGTTCVIPESLGEANCSDLVIIQRPLIEPHFIAFYMNSAAQKHVEVDTVGIALAHFNTASVASLAIPVPPHAEQVEIVREVERRLMAADKLALRIENQLILTQTTRQSLLREAFTGRLIPQSANDEPASVLLERIQAEKTHTKSEKGKPHQVERSRKLRKGINSMQEPSSLPQSLSIAWEKIGREANARRLFDEAGFSSDQVIQFYEALRATPEVHSAFQGATKRKRQSQRDASHSRNLEESAKGNFRLVDLWLEDFKNLKDYTVYFEPAQGIDVVLGWNGTGKSNLFEALVIIFRDLHLWAEKNRWPSTPMKGFKITYEIDQNTVEVTWTPGHMKRPEIKAGKTSRNADHDRKLDIITRQQLPLPRFLFGYYSGPTNRLAEHFLPMKQAHYERLRKAKSDDPETLAALLEQRRFFCAETHHAKYVLLAFCYKEDLEINRFLEDRLRIVGFESALFVIRKPRWSRNNDPEDFWGATGIMRRVMERLREFAIAPMVIEQTVFDGYNSAREDHYYFFLPDLQSLHDFAAEYANARTFFLALESTDFSELIYDLKIQVRIKANNTEQIPITFRELSEGEQQLLMVLGLLRFTKSHQSLVLLDEPDTHLNPHWSVKYLKDLTRVMSDSDLESSEQQSSQILMATHDPLVIASLVKEQIHLLKRDTQTGICWWSPASVNPRGLGFTGILTSEMFGFRSDLDPETLSDLDNRVRLIAKDGELTAKEKKELESIDTRLTEAGFSKAFSDPYYSAFVRAWGRRYSELMADQEFLTTEKQQEIDRIAREVLEEAITEVEKETTH